MTPSNGVKIATRFGIASASVFAAGLLFRFALYRHIYLAPDAAYGGADVIEFVLGWALLLLLGAAALFALALAVRGPKPNRVAGAWLLVTCGTIAALLVPLHNVAAKWAI